MIIILGKFITRDVSSLYNIERIAEDGVIFANKRKISIYKVNPVNIIAWNKEMKNKIISAYIATLRGMPDMFQIVVTKQKSTLKNDIELYKKRLLEVENYGLKMALKNYVEYLQKIENENGIYEIKHYLIVEEKGREETENIHNAFLNMNEFGMEIKRVNRKAEVENVIKRAMET